MDVNVVTTSFRCHVDCLCVGSGYLYDLIATFEDRKQLYYLYNAYQMFASMVLFYRSITSYYIKIVL